MTTMHIRNAFPLAVVLAAAALPAAAGQYDTPYSLFQAARRQPAHGIEPATIMRIDEERVRPHRSPPVAPGMHEVEVSVPAGAGRTVRLTLAVDAQPCTRYFFGARRVNGSHREWEAFVESFEAIGECRARFAKAG